MPFLDCAAGAGDVGFVMGRACFGEQMAAAFFGAVRGGLVFTSAANVFSSPSARLRTVCRHAPQRVRNVYSKQGTSMLCHQTLCPQHSRWTPSMRSSRHWRRNYISYRSAATSSSCSSSPAAPGTQISQIIFIVFFFNFGGPYKSSCFLFNQIHTFPSCFISLPL